MPSPFDELGRRAARVTAGIGILPLGAIVAFHVLDATFRLDWPIAGLCWMLLVPPALAHVGQATNRALSLRWNVRLPWSTGLLLSRCQVVTGILLLAYIPHHLLDRRHGSPIGWLEPMASAVFFFHIANGLRLASTRWGLFVGSCARAGLLRITFGIAALGGGLAFIQVLREWTSLVHR